MHTSWRSLLLTAACIVGQAAAAPLVSVVVRDTVDAVPVMPGGVQDLVITAANTLNATNSSPIPANTTVNTHRLSIQATQRLPLNLVNNIGGAVNAYITGLDPSGRVVFVQPNGESPKRVSLTMQVWLTVKRRPILLPGCRCLLHYPTRGDQRQSGHSPQYCPR